MNIKLIHQIMNQAGTDVSGKWMGIAQAEKFAELIVAECANLIDSMEHSSQYFPHVADAIKKHFEVEE